MQAMRRPGHSSHLLLAPVVPLPLLSQLHSTAPPSPERYEDPLSEPERTGFPNIHPTTNKQSMLVFVKLSADFPRGVLLVYSVASNTEDRSLPSDIPENGSYRRA